MNAQQRQLFEETLAADEASLQAQLDSLQTLTNKDAAKAPGKPRIQPKRQLLPEHLERVTHHHEPEDTTCACGQPMRRIGEDVSERLVGHAGARRVQGLRGGAEAGAANRRRLPGACPQEVRRAAQERPQPGGGRGGAAHRLALSPGGQVRQLPPAQRLLLRQARAKPAWDALHAWPQLERRRPWLFAGSGLAGQRAAMVMSLPQSAKLHGHDPWIYLKDVLQRLPTHLNSRIEELLPHCWQPSAS